LSIPCEKDLIDIVAALSIPVIALIAAYIAWQQWRVNERRLKHELFDRNFLVYEAILKFIGSVVTSGKAKDENLYNFNQDTRAAKFLLGDDVSAFIIKIYNKAIDLQTLDAELEGLPVGEERTRIVRERGEIKKWIYHQFGELDNKFEHVLGLEREPSIYNRLTKQLSRRKKPRGSA
jgi:hypothetical protein